MNCGSWVPLRQPSWPPSSAVWLLEFAIASWPKSSPFDARAARSWALWVISSQLLRSGGFGQRQQDMRYVEFIVGGRTLLAGEELLQLVRASH